MNGLYHFTKEEYADKIMESQTIHPSGGAFSLGAKKVFFYAGIPSLEQVRENMADKYRQYEWTAIKIVPGQDELKDYKVRALDDMSVAHKGECELEGKNVKKVNLVLDMNENGDLFIREKTPEEIEKGPYRPRQEIIDKFGVKENEKPNLIRSTIDSIAAYGQLLKRPAKLAWDNIKKGINTVRNTIGGNKEMNEENAPTDIVDMKEVNRQKQLDFLADIRETSSRSVEPVEYRRSQEISRSVPKISKDEIDSR